MAAADDSSVNSLLLWIMACKAFEAITPIALGIALLTTRHSEPV